MPDREALDASVLLAASFGLLRGHDERLRASVLAIVGEVQRARDLMARLLRVASPLGLYAEEFDADTGRQLGNFPRRSPTSR
jgi:GH15 family glucan-1,4-alpha-glucosidase